MAAEYHPYVWELQKDFIRDHFPNQIQFVSMAQLTFCADRLI